MNSNDNKTNRQGYDFHHSDTVILVICLDEGYFATMYRVLNCCTEVKRKLPGLYIFKR
jgi:hypothetical protein